MLLAARADVTLHPAKSAKDLNGKRLCRQCVGRISAPLPSPAYTPSLDIDTLPPPLLAASAIIGVHASSGSETSLDLREHSKAESRSVSQQASAKPNFLQWALIGALLSWLCWLLAAAVSFDSKL